MISKDDLVNIGHISRPHSFKGEIQITLNKKVALDQGDFIFVQIEGQFIPFKILAMKGKPNEPVLNLEFVTTFDEAQELVRNSIFLDLAKVQEEESEISFLGFELVDKHLGTIGIVKDVQELPQQIILVVDYQNKECLIPLVEDFIDYISAENQEIWLNLPNGLLDI